MRLLHPSSGQGPLVHSVQKVHLHRLLQSRLFTTVAPLVDMYNTLRILFYPIDSENTPQFQMLTNFIHVSLVFQ